MAPEAHISVKRILPQNSIHVGSQHIAEGGMTEAEPAERISARTVELVEQLFVTGRTVIRTAGWLVGAYFAKDAIVALAGQSTNVTVNAAFSLLADMKFTFTLTLAGASTAWAIIERSLRHHKVEYLQDRIKKFEHMLDPKRSSSGLTPKGKTNPKDKKS